MISGAGGGESNVKLQPQQAQCISKLMANTKTASIPVKNNTDNNLLHRSILFTEGICQMPPENTRNQGCCSLGCEGVHTPRNTWNFPESSYCQERSGSRLKSNPTQASCSRRHGQLLSSFPICAHVRPPRPPHPPVQQSREKTERQAQDQALLSRTLC